MERCRKIYDPFHVTEFCGGRVATLKRENACALFSLPFYRHKKNTFDLNENKLNHCRNFSTIRELWRCGMFSANMAVLVLCGCVYKEMHYGFLTAPRKHEKKNVVIKIWFFHVWIYHLPHRNIYYYISYIYMCTLIIVNSFVECWKWKIGCYLMLVEGKLKKFSFLLLKPQPSTFSSNQLLMEVKIHST